MKYLHFVGFVFWLGSTGVTTNHKQAYGQHVKEDQYLLRQCQEANFEIP